MAMCNSRAHGTDEEGQLSSVSALCDGALALPFFLWWPNPLSTCPKYWARMGIRPFGFEFRVFQITAEGILGASVMGTDLNSSSKPIVKAPSMPSGSFSRHSRLKGTKVGNVGCRKVRLLGRDLSRRLTVGQSSWIAIASALLLQVLLIMKVGFLCPDCMILWRR